MIRPDPLAVLVEAIEPRLFSSGRIPVPNLDDVYELQLAFYENLILSDEELLRNAGYFSRVNSDYTRHFLMCVGEPLKLPEHSSSRLKSFFEKNIFRTGYATHGLFPYRGKFHPQMVKGLLNAMGLKPGQTVLDPMMGSGTVAVEASLMGIHSVGLDASPFLGRGRPIVTVWLQELSKRNLDAGSRYGSFSGSISAAKQDVRTCRARIGTLSRTRSTT